MLPHQLRVIDEKAALDVKAAKLSDFIGNSPLFETFDSAEQERMKEQCEIMWQYSEILGKRIAAFTKDQETGSNTLQSFDGHLIADEQWILKRWGGFNYLLISRNEDFMLDFSSDGKLWLHCESNCGVNRLLLLENPARQEIVDVEKLFGCSQ